MVAVAASPPPDPAAADDQLVRFARLVAHGLRNPLAIATGMLDLLDRQVGDQLDDEMRELVTRSSDALRRAGDLVLDLQRYTSATRRPLELEAVDLAERVAWAADEVGVAAIGGAVVVDGPLPELHADGEAVGRVLVELFDNAVRWSAPDRPPTITVRAADAGDRWRITVTDDGPGIPAGQREAAFAEGERLGRTGDGFGLGLATVRVLVERHGGEAHLEDAAPPSGTTVALTWPKSGTPAAGSLGEQAP